MRDRKRVIVIIAAIVVLLAGILIPVLVHLGRKQVNQGGEGTNFPYTWKEESRGTVLVKLDGSKSPEGYYWNAVSSNEKILKVEVAKKEKNGIISYRVTPLAEGAAQITFTRQRDVQQNTENPEDTLTEGSMSDSGSTADGGEMTAENGTEAGTGDEAFSDEAILIEELPEEEPSTDEVSEDENMADLIYESYLDRFRAKDVTGEITILFEVNPVKKGKLKANYVLAMENEHKGIMESTDESLDYKLWEESAGTIQARLPMLEEGWEVSWEGEYVPPEDPGIPGITIPEPEQENGQYVILKITNVGFIEGAMCYSIQGLAQGTATIKFTDASGKRRIVVDVEISSDGVVTVLSHRLETF